MRKNPARQMKTGIFIAFPLLPSLKKGTFYFHYHNFPLRCKGSLSFQFQWTECYTLLMKKQYPWMLSFLIFGILFSNCVKKGPLPPWISKISMLQTPIGSEEIFRLPNGDQIT